MTAERLELLRQQARAEAAERAGRSLAGGGISHTPPSPDGPADVAYGETACPRCGVRSGVGCRHRPPGEEGPRLTSHLQLRIADAPA